MSEASSAHVVLSTTVFQVLTEIPLKLCLVQTFKIFHIPSKYITVRFLLPHPTPDTNFCLNILKESSRDREAGWQEQEAGRSHPYPQTGSRENEQETEQGYKHIDSPALS